MDRTFIDACGGFSTAYDNWNEIFQLAWELEDSTCALAQKRQEELYRVEKAFQDEAVQGVKLIVQQTETAASGPRRLPQHHLCYKERNIFYRLLPDARSGRSYVASLRGILQSRSDALTVPLSTVVVYRGVAVLAQALVPLDKAPTRLHEGHVAHRPELASELCMAARALNIPLPDQLLCNAYEGKDGRFYVTSTNVTTIALDDSTLLDGPLKRAEMLFSCGCVTATCEDTLSVLRSEVVMQAFRQVALAPVAEQQELLCHTLHFYGINLCLLKGVLDGFRDECVRSGESGRVWDSFLRAVAREMLARSIKQEFYLEAHAKRLSASDASISKCFALQLKEAFEGHLTGPERFMHVVTRKYAIANSEGADRELLDALYCARRDCRSEIVERVSHLVGARAAATVPAVDGEPSPSGRKTVVWAPVVVARLTPRNSDPRLLLSLVPVYTAGTTLADDDRTVCCHGPLQVKTALWEGRVKDAIELATQLIALTKTRFGDGSLPNLYAQRRLCRLLYATPSMAHIRQGSSTLVHMLKGFEERTSAITRARCHLEAGCWLLVASHTTPSLVAEAARHFECAAQLLPAHLRSSFGAWLYIQPSLGLLRCRQAQQRPIDPIVTASLTKDAVYLSRIVSPQDYFVEYLWELGMELSVDHQYEEATRILTSAVGMLKKVPVSLLDSDALLDDTLSVYRTWNPRKYENYCEALAAL